MTDHGSYPGPGDARCPGPSTADILRADGDPLPEALTSESYRFMGDEDIPYSRYTSPDFFAREMARMWPRVWQWACRLEHIPEVGDHLVYDIGPHSILIVRSAPDRIQAFHNACLHRGTQLRPSGSIGSAPRFRCPFHGWSWRLDGTLEDIPCRWDFPHMTDERARLPDVKVGIWGGFVFINLDPDAEPLESYLGVLPDHFRDGWDLSRRTIALHIQKELPTNWKAAQEAFLEAYHIIETHPQALVTAGDANAQYDVFGDHVSRFVHTIGSPSPHLAERPSEQQIFEKMRLGEPGRRLEPGETARSAAAAILRERLGESWGVDLSGYSTSEMLDSIEYHLFPNMCLFGGVSLPMIYRFRPIGMDPGRTLFDLVFLRPLKPAESPPFPPDPVTLGVDDSYTSVPGLDPGLGGVFDQDTNNLALQWRGFHASKKPGQTLGNYQEIRARHLHATLDRYLS
jgi:phenylpropionate dioxygenase-like ring-hydroxylating dioxygenase large terminal subunit